MGEMYGNRHVQPLSGHPERCIAIQGSGVPIVIAKATPGRFSTAHIV